MPYREKVLSLYRAKGENMTHTATQRTQRTAIQPQYDSRCNFWYANFDGTCIAIGDTRADVEKQINAFLGIL